MRNILIALALSTAVAAPAMAEVAKGQTLYDGAGKRLGKIDSVGADGSVSIIFRGKFVSVPGDTVSEAEGKVMTKLSKQEVGKIR